MAERNEFLDKAKICRYFQPGFGICEYGLDPDHAGEGLPSAADTTLRKDRQPVCKFRLNASGKLSSIAVELQEKECEGYSPRGYTTFRRIPYGANGRY